MTIYFYCADLKMKKGIFLGEFRTSIKSNYNFFFFGYRPKIIVELTLSTSEELVSNIVDEATMMLNDFLRNNQTTEAELMAVVDVNIEDSAPKSPSDNISLLLIGSVLTLIFIVCLITNLVVVCYLRQDSSSFAEFNLSNVQQYNRNHVEEITNNLQNKKKLTKDTNTINDTDFSGPSKVSI